MPEDTSGTDRAPETTGFTTSRVESLLLSAARIVTFDGPQVLTNASGFFYRSGDRLYLVTSRHVLVDEASDHFPDRLEIELHIDAGNLAMSTGFSILLYRNGQGIWRQCLDAGGDIDVAAIEIDRAALPDSAVYTAFTPDHLTRPEEAVEVGTSVLVVGFPLGFHDALHHLPVVRDGIVASSFGLRFQGLGYFLTDARTHRGSSGAPIVTRAAADAHSVTGELPWILLGVHSARLDLATRDLGLDEALGLNCAWYADVLRTLTAG